jgi:hypothetical protein
VTHHDSLVVVWIGNTSRFVDWMNNVSCLGGEGELGQTTWLNKPEI